VKKRKRKPRYPKGFDPENPGPPPDPERWLPKHERAEYRKRRKRSQRNQPVSKGAQVLRGSSSTNRACASTSCLCTDDGRLVHASWMTCEHSLVHSVAAGAWSCGRVSGQVAHHYGGLGRALAACGRAALAYTHRSQRRARETQGQAMKAAAPACAVRYLGFHQRSFRETARTASPVSTHSAPSQAGVGAPSGFARQPTALCLDDCEA
jgi:hypothetical protein